MTPEVIWDMTRAIISVIGVVAQIYILIRVLSGRY